VEPSDVVPGPPPLQPLHVDVQRVVLIGTAVWLVALVVILAVPDLHHGSRDWWPWAALTGALLGLVGLAYLRRGRGNAATQ
jgi:uncharacterized membrane protein